MGPRSIQKVFITGANGFVACHIVNDLIKVGYMPIASVRSRAKAQEMLEAHPGWRDIIRFVYVPDFTVPGAFDEAIKQESGQLKYVIHTASPVTFNITDIQKQLIDPAVKGTTSLLESVHRYAGPQVRRIVLLSSTASILNSLDDTSAKGEPYDETCWNPVTAEIAVKEESPLLGYCAAKTLAEKAAWQFLRDNKTSFDMTALNPDVIIGPMLHNVSEPGKINETNRLTVYNFIDGTRTGTGAWGLPFYNFVDVRDVSRAHILAMHSPATSNQRMLLVSGVITPQLVVDIIRKHFPELKDRVPVGNPTQVVPDGAVISRWNNEKCYQMFGKDWTYRDLETSVVDTVKDMLRLTHPDP
ncbi:hypothetical protein V495_04076 [Pseudogymnoascus sp. VKM F-4514 (FW-929)]|nr:hypothetical protein V495_04076 [Pseudogymnoascus sp. VKM F-4514 (FW-929)]KFY57850.1 hypothetical protein V497_05254 [Pseudogymnoascus sp. VKM F-4516 (FW-969)]